MENSDRHFYWSSGIFGSPWMSCLSFIQGNQNLQDRIGSFGQRLRGLKSSAIAVGRTLGAKLPLDSPVKLTDGCSLSRLMKSFLWAIFLGLGLGAIAIPRSTLAQLSSPRQAPAPPEDAQITCDILVVGGGLAGVAATEEGLRAGRTICLTEITDWIGGQISARALRR